MDAGARARLRAGDQSEQLEDARYKSKGYKPGDIIGQDGVEASMTNSCAAATVSVVLFVDSRGHIQRELDRVEPQSGQDIVLTIDSDPSGGRRRPTQKISAGSRRDHRDGSNNGEILALASRRLSIRIFSRNASPAKKGAPNISNC
jgi:penicillin-binding protein 2